MRNKPRKPRYLAIWVRQPNLSAAPRIPKVLHQLLLALILEAVSLWVVVPLYWVPGATFVWACSI